ncbi:MULTISPECIES: LysR substrate-binding domain-containing protein [unclassified Streptomyces]|uniref:LysR substrate-binding domain-containing protein n=1 Tax=unclassified Streptomyces TaxID=2593676 RepID=UPI0013697D78|nr:MULTISPECIES: LysR substrate-binding domain-containing protein [unclassified Streptomyces]MCW5251379.1 LysR family transcriptional regulator [Streptomyces sp. SHP 1-2]MYU22551.1 LysR family transcriptional regulator [Streptomyces sp. SID8352]
MDLRRLRYFVAVAEERHFGRAAQRLHMAQPPLSQAIRQLEDELGVLLLRRTTRRVDLTDAGRAYLGRARAILADVDEAAHHARRVAAGAVGHLTLACVGSATYSLLPALSRHLATELPGIDFSFRGEMLAPDQVEALRGGTIDVALLRPVAADPSLTVHTLRRDRLVVALPAEHPLAARARVRAADLAGTDLIVHAADRHSVMHGVVLGLLREAGVDPRIRHEVGETSTLITLVAGGLGAAVVPEPVTALALDGVVYRPLVRPAATIDLAVAHRADRTEPHLARAVEAVRRLF